MLYRTSTVHWANYVWLRAASRCAGERPGASRPVWLAFGLDGQGANHPCFCLCLGFSQMTITRPLRLMILHFSHIGFTDGLTFIFSASLRF
jgi:hypothetical protein